MTDIGKHFERFGIRRDSVMSSVDRLFHCMLIEIRKVKTNSSIADCVRDCLNVAKILRG